MLFVAIYSPGALAAWDNTPGYSLKEVCLLLGRQAADAKQALAIIRCCP